MMITKDVSMSKTIKAKKIPDRPTFYLDDEETQPIRAGGVLLYRNNEGSIDLLLVENRGYYEDLGGCTDTDDKDFYDTVARETEEESNKMIKYKSIHKRIRDAAYIYMERSKYIVFIVEATERESKLKQADFGSKEIHDDFERTIKWIPMDVFFGQDIIQHKLNFRLKNKKLFDKLKLINTDAKLSIRYI